MTGLKIKWFTPPVVVRSGFGLNHVNTQGRIDGSELWDGTVYTVVDFMSFLGFLKSGVETPVSTCNDGEYGGDEQGGNNCYNKAKSL